MGIDLFDKTVGCCTSPDINIATIPQSIAFDVGLDRIEASAQRRMEKKVHMDDMSLFESIEVQLRKDGFFRRKRRLIVIILLCCLTLMAVSVATIFTIIKVIQEDANEVNANSLSAMHETDSDRFHTLQEFLKPISGDRLYDETSRQYVALRWLADVDPMQLKLEISTEKEIIQRYIAAMLYFGTDGENWTYDYKFLSNRFVCHWNDMDITHTKHGIGCNENQSISYIHLVDNNLKFHIPSELNQLTDLESIHLYFNKLSGTIPELDQLHSLEEIDLDSNQLSGTVPESLFALPNIRQLLLLNNQNITGTMPEMNNIASESRLEAISFYKCSLTGTIPESFGEITTLRFLQFFRNELTGSIPSSITMLPNLESLGLLGNHLTGTIPEFNSQLALRTISLAENQLDGTLPASIGSLDALYVLYLNNNNLSGTLPSSINNLPLIRHLWLHRNKFSGTLPILFGNQGSIEQAYFSQNNFTGNLNNFFDFVPTSLQAVDVSNNQLEGTIPPKIGRLSGLEYLGISHNDLEGTFPPTMTSLSHLHTLSLDGNEFRGTIPPSWSNMVSLNWLDLSGNKLTGSLPSQLGQLTLLTYLDLSSNLLEGVIPSNLGQLDNLVDVKLHLNQLFGDMTSIFCNSQTSIEEISSDCAGSPPEVVCDCCTLCCDDQRNCISQ